MMSEIGISEEEFIVFQQKMNEERQELFAIKETCKELKKVDTTSKIFSGLVIITQGQNIWPSSD